MPHYAGGARTLCPYYRREGKTCIDCEGHSPGMIRRITFRDREGKRRWQARRCYTMEYARRCPHARVLEHKYGNGKDG